MNRPEAALQRLLVARATGRLAEVCSELGLRLLVAFGSTVDPDDRAAARDLDLAVELADDADIVAVLVALVDIAGTDDVDLMDLDRAGLVARSRALGPGICLFQAEPGHFARQQMSAMSMAWDTAWLRRRDLEALASRWPSPTSEPS